MEKYILNIFNASFYVLKIKVHSEDDRVFISEEGSLNCETEDIELVINENRVHIFFSYALLYVLKI